MINLYPFRRALFPVLGRRFPRAKFVGDTDEREFAGVVEADPHTVERALSDWENVYVNNTAKLKYYETEDGRVYESASYAHRPDGFFGRWQTHIRLFEHESGTALICHYELNPWSRPDDHYGGKHGTWQPHKGVNKSRVLFNDNGITVDTTASIDGISNT